MPNDDNRFDKHALTLPEYKCLLCSENLSALFSGSVDFESREIFFGLEGKISLHLFWLDGVVSGESVA